MKKISIAILCLTITLVNCGGMNARVVRQTERSAVITGAGISKIEATMNAEDKARELFGNFKKIAEPECSEQVSGHAGKHSAHVNSYIACTIQVEKQ